MDAPNDTIGRVRRLQPALTLVGIVMAWEFVVRVASVPTWILPPPSLIMEALIKRWDEIPMHAMSTIATTLAGFVLAVIGGVGIAVLIFYWRFLHDSVMPILVVLQAVPKVALAPLLLIWIGYGEPTIVAIAFLVAFFPLVVGTVTGLRAVEPELLDLSRTLSAGELQMFWKVRLPSALPFIFSAGKVAITLALIGAVIGEFVSSSRGLGYMVLIASSNLNTALAFAGILILGVVGIILYYAVEGAERVAIPWF